MRQPAPTHRDREGRVYVEMQDADTYYVFLPPLRNAHAHTFDERTSFPQPGTCVELVAVAPPYARAYRRVARLVFAPARARHGVVMFERAHFR